MEDYEIITWPEIQMLQEQEEFQEHATLIEPNENMGIEGCTYLIEKNWLKTINYE